MAKQEVQLTFTFVNPNTPKEFEKQFRKILIEKLLALYSSGVYAASSPRGEPLSINYTQKREDNILPYEHIIHYSLFVIHYSFLHL